MASDIVVPILFRKGGGTFTQLGTGFVIAAMGNHAVVVTAAHVLKEISDRTQKSAPPALFNDGTTQLRTVLAGDEDEQIVLFKTAKATFHGEVTHSWGCSESDLAILCVDVDPKANQLVTNQFLISSRLPDVGSPVLIRGYFASSDVSAQMIPPGFEGLIKHLMGGLPSFMEGTVSQMGGKVVDVFYDRHILVKGPCFQIDVPINSGMSGGPVFQITEGGQPVVIGAMSSDDGAEEDLSLGTGKSAIAASLVTLLGMELSINGHFPLTYSNASVQPTIIRTLRDLIALGVIVDTAVP
jgi:S1-C subfamily serine protease